ncbi:MAG: exodeoxyribonuclease VII large subunit [Nitrospirota bacterium]|nr:exodeoxyribonuclease VII large subunit [Nitrospirota bacterium]MDH4360874.1 exodeoxyribonuclease VII large subunit [Nitrospirota bacterium]
MSNSSHVPGLFPSLLTVSALTRQIRSTLEQNFPSLWVEGEISNLRCPSSGHRYFTLKDQSSQIRAVLFRSQVERLKFVLQDGLEVFVLGRVSVYEPRGDYQLLLEALEPKGIGALQLAFLQLKAKLEAEGLFEPARKKSLPQYPQRIGLVTSPVGAAIHDLLTIMHRRWPFAQVLIAPVAVQGDEAVGQIVGAIQALNELGELDVLIVGRGGGSLEDLWAFNEECVVRAIASSRIPVVSAVGHETDVTLSDLAADCRAPTPSAAAELVVPDCFTVRHHLGHHQVRLERSMRSMIAARTVRVQVQTGRLPEPRLMLGKFVQQVDDLERQLYVRMKHWCRNLQMRLLSHQSAIWERNPLYEIHRQQRALIERGTRLVRGISGCILAKRHQTELWVSQLNQLSPLAVLARGYSIVHSLRDGKVVKKSTDVSAGESVRARLHEGELICLVQRTHPPS